MQCDRNWMSIPLATSKSKIKQKGTKNYNWCLKATGIPLIRGYDRWVMHSLKEFNSLRKRNQKAKVKAQRAKLTKRHAGLTLKSATVALKRARIISDTDDHFPNTLSDKSDVTAPVEGYDSK